MKFIPILFSTPMVQAIKEGRKTMTRRIVKPQPIDNTEVDGNFFEGNHKGFVKVDNRHNWREQFADEFSKYQIGNTLWVKEAFYAFGHWTKITDFSTGKVEWEFQDLTLHENLEYKYFDNPPELVYKRSNKKLGWHKRSSLFMPKSACRIFLEITNVIVERLQDISWEDAEAEGCSGYRPTQDEPTHQFKRLWQSINGKDSWEANPWVWVIEFKRIEKPENFN